MILTPMKAKNMTAKQYLSQIRRMEQQIQQRLVELKKLRIESTYLKGISYDGVRVQSQSTGFPGAERIADKELEVLRLIDQMQSLRHTIIMQIQSLSDDEDGLLYSSILFERYVNHLDFAEIACNIRRSYTHTIRLHGEALKMFSKKVDIR